MNLLKIAVATALTVSAALAQTIPHPVPPQGRLTLVSDTPVMTSDVTGATTVYYTSYVGGWLPIPVTPQTFTQISLPLETTIQTSGNIYDIFAVDVTSGDVTNFYLCTGPAWTNSTTRSVGVGLSGEGLWVNAATLSHCYNGLTDYGGETASNALYLGSIYMTANGQTGVSMRPSGASGGSNNIIGLFNAYNRVKAYARSIDTTSGGWSYSSTTVREADGSASNRISFLDGLGEVPIFAQYTSGVYPSSNNGLIGVGINSTTAFTDPPAYFGSPGSYYQASPTGTASAYPVLGFNYVQALEANSSTATISYGASENPMLVLTFEF